LLKGKNSLYHSLQITPHTGLFLFSHKGAKAQRFQIRENVSALVMAAMLEEILGLEMVSTLHPGEKDAAVGGSASWDRETRKKCARFFAMAKSKKNKNREEIRAQMEALLMKVISEISF